jgi:anaerobic selenocysteine-containing dehydrogenase
LTVNPIRPVPLAADEYLMMSIRTHDQFNTTVYGLDDRYRGVYNGRHVIFMNQEDMVDAHLAKEDVVDIHSDFGGVRRTARRFVVVPYQIPRRCVATYFPETNVLVPIDSQAEKSGTPTSKSVAVTLSRHIPGQTAG